jgi:hypothetical protein
MRMLSKPEKMDGLAVFNRIQFFMVCGYQYAGRQTAAAQAIESASDMA